MLKLLFDLVTTQPTRTTKIHGGGKYGEMILYRILERNIPVCCCYDSQKWLNPDIEKVLDEKSIKLYDIRSAGVNEIIKEQSIDVFYIPAYVNAPNYIDVSQCPVICTIHDLRGLELPVDYYQIKYKPWRNVLSFGKKALLKRLADKKDKDLIGKVLKADNFQVITDTYHSAYAFKSYFPTYNKDIPIFYAPSTIKYETHENAFMEKYFLLVSGNRYNKNNLRAIEALDRLFTYGCANGYKVKITGVKSKETFRYTINNPERFEFCGFVDEKELDQLYHDAYCLIYPSLNEGFGYPPVEAMHYGVPVLASPFTSIPEVCGDSAIYFNPFSVEEIMNRILMIIEPEWHEKYSKLAKERYAYITKKQQADLDRLIDYIYNFKS